MSALVALIFSLCALQKLFPCLCPMQVREIVFSKKNHTTTLKQKFLHHSEKCQKNVLLRQMRTKQRFLCGKLYSSF